MYISMQKSMNHCGLVVKETAIIKDLIFWIFFSSNGKYVNTLSSPFIKASIFLQFFSTAANVIDLIF